MANGETSKSLSLRRRALLYIKAAKRILGSDFDAAFQAKDYNIGIRRAQEAVELAVKAVYLFMGEEHPWGHNPDPIGLPPRIFAGLEKTHFIESGDGNSGFSMIKRVGNVWTEIASSNFCKSRPPLRFEDVGTGVKIVDRDDLELAASCDPTYFDIEKCKDDLKKIRKYVKSLAAHRSKVFYFERVVDNEEAGRVREEAWLVVRWALRTMESLSVGSFFSELGTD